MRDLHVRLIKDLSDIVKTLETELATVNLQADRLRGDLARWHDAWHTDTAALEAEVQRLHDGIVRHRDALRNRGVDGRGTPAQAPNERLWALVDQQEAADG